MSLDLEPERHMSRVGFLAGQSATLSNREDLVFSTKPMILYKRRDPWSSFKYSNVDLKD